MLYLAFFSFEKSWSLLPMMLSLFCFPTFSGYDTSCGFPIFWLEYSFGMNVGNCLLDGSPHRSSSSCSCQLLHHVHQVNSFCNHFGGVASVGESASFADDRISVVVDVYDEDQVTIVAIPVVLEG